MISSSGVSVRLRYLTPSESVFLNPLSSTPSINSSAVILFAAMFFISSESSLSATPIVRHGLGAILTYVERSEKPQIDALMHIDQDAQCFRGDGPKKISHDIRHQCLDGNRIADFMTELEDCAGV
jgi:hypothetical protein